jgi:hypothetical protein
MDINGQVVNVALDTRLPPGGGAPPVGLYATDSTNAVFFHLTADCSGTRYLSQGGTGPVTAGVYSSYQVYTVSNQLAPIYLFYPTGAGISAAAGSAEQFSTGADPTQPGTCYPMSPTQVNARGAGTSQPRLQQPGAAYQLHWRVGLTLPRNAARRRRLSQGVVNYGAAL